MQVAAPAKAGLVHLAQPVTPVQLLDPALVLLHKMQGPSFPLASTKYPSAHLVHLLVSVPAAHVAQFSSPHFVYEAVVADAPDSLKYPSAQA